MNKNRGIIKILGISLFVLISVIPIETYAESQAGHTTSESKPSDCKQKDGTSCNTVCSNHSKISFDVTKYNLTTGVYTSKADPRTITITSPRKFKVYYFVGDYNKLDSIDENSSSKEEDDVITKHKTIKTKETSGTYKGKYKFTYTLSEGKEVQFIVFSQGENKTGKKYCVGDNCKTTKEIECPNGKLTLGGQDIDVTKITKKVDIDNSGILEYKGQEYMPTELEISGNAAALFVQNPGGGDSGLVDNIRYYNGTDQNPTPYNKACFNAYHGKYISNNKQEKEEYTIKDPNLLNDWHQKYYSQVLYYCTQPQFAYNIDNDKIQETSNLLLEIFKDSGSLLEQASNTPSIEAINQKINQIIKEIEEKYNVREKSSSKGHILRQENGDSPTLDLQCDYKHVGNDTFYQKKIDTVGDNTAGKEPSTFTKMVRDEEYIYITDPKKSSKYAYLKTRKSDTKKSQQKKVKVCDVQCYEKLTVTYDAPQTVIAGMCLAYKVTVKSETECGVETVDLKDSLVAPNSCSPVPICSNKETSTQAGPSDEFDFCVMQCDGGKYSQSCINKCYKDVYENTKSEKNVTSTKSTSKDYDVSASFLYNTNDENYQVSRLAYENEDLKTYYKGTYKKCNTNKKIYDNIDHCAEYFFYAKSIYSMGEYNESGTKWKSDEKISKSNYDSLDVVDIPMQIGRAAPFYLRSVAATKSLLLDLLGKGSNDIYRKYNIWGDKDSNGIKRQWSKRYQCDEVCSFTGCKKSDAMDPDEYASVLKYNIKEISDKLKECNASAACDTKSSNSSFEIEVKTKRKSSKQITDTKWNGNTRLENTTSVNNNPMFQPRYWDNPYLFGIIGKCYDKNSSNPHYQTTITFNTWINIKTQEMLYTPQSTTTHKAQTGEYCLPWDSEDVNVPYWMWAEVDKYQGNRITSWKPETKDDWNITAVLGNNDRDDHKFGKYGWAIKFSCFYALNNEVCDCKNNPDECPNPDICKVPYETRCKSENSTDICNTKFRIIDQKNMFPTSKGSGSRNVGFNWTSKAIDYNVPSKTSYDIDPEKYYKQLETEAKSVSEDSPGGIYDTTKSDYIVWLSKDNIKTIKDSMKKESYTEFEQELNSTSSPIDPEGLRHYSIAQDFINKYTSKFEKKSANINTVNNDSNPTGNR